MRQNELHPAAGSTAKRKRVGRGLGSGHGAYSGRGCKGQKARSGRGKTIPGFEGGQLRLIKRLPRKRGFVNIFRQEYHVVNLDNLSVFDPGTEVTSEQLLQAGLVKDLAKPIKILAKGELAYPLTVRAHKFSAAAKTKIEAAGGKAEVVA